MPIRVPPEVLKDAGKTVALKARIKAVLEAEVGDYHESARLSYVLLEIGIEAFARSGVPQDLVGMLFNAICHGASMDKALQALMLLSEEGTPAPATDSRPDGEEASARPSKKRVH